MRRMVKAGLLSVAVVYGVALALFIVLFVLYVAYGPTWGRDAADAINAWSHERALERERTRQP